MTETDTVGETDAQLEAGPTQMMNGTISPEDCPVDHTRSLELVSRPPVVFDWLFPQVFLCPACQTRLVETGWFER